jgi:hypothetical protein
MSKFHQVLLGGLMALSLAACSSTGTTGADATTTSGSTSPGASTATGMGGTNNGVVRDSTTGNGVPSSAGQAGSGVSNTTTTTTTTSGTGR